MHVRASTGAWAGYQESHSDFVPWSPPSQIPNVAPPHSSSVYLYVADSDSQCSPTRHSLSLSEGEEQMDRLQHVELVRTTPMSHWKAGTVQAWLEVVMAMPMYVKACAENVKSGKVGSWGPRRYASEPSWDCYTHPGDDWSPYYSRDKKKYSIEVGHLIAGPGHQ